MREIRGRLGLEIWRAMGFEPIVDSSGRLLKMIVRAWLILVFILLKKILIYEQGPEAGTCTVSRERRTGGRCGNWPSARLLGRTDTESRSDGSYALYAQSRVE